MGSPPPFPFPCGASPFPFPFPFSPFLFVCPLPLLPSSSPFSIPLFLFFFLLLFTFEDDLDAVFALRRIESDRLAPAGLEFDLDKVAVTVGLYATLARLLASCGEFG